MLRIEKNIRQKKTSWLAERVAEYSGVQHHFLLCEMSLCRIWRHARGHRYVGARLVQGWTALDFLRSFFVSTVFLLVFSKLVVFFLLCELLFSKWFSFQLLIGRINGFLNWSLNRQNKCLNKVKSSIRIHNKYRNVTSGYVSKTSTSLYKHYIKSKCRHSTCVGYQL